MMGRNPDTFIPHLERYIFSLPYCWNKKVMDAGSKDGYGSHLISSFASSITLVDYKARWLEYAKRYNFFCPTDYIVCDFEKDFPKGEWETIVAFEIIEHLENPEFFLMNVNKQLTKGGCFVFSIPHEADVKGHKVIFHSDTEVKNLISKHLTLKEFYIQDKSPIKNIPFLGVPTPLTYIGIAIKK